jgi:hypothetical protein
LDIVSATSVAEGSDRYYQSGPVQRVVWKG